MDTSETYIKMSDTPEIQKKWDRKGGDFALNVPNNESVPIVYTVCGHTWDKDIWLPRQDQLQEMLDDEPVRLLNRFIRWFRWESANIDLTKIDASMEQLWLAFVMKEKYNKVWNGKEWKASRA